MRRLSAIFFALSLCAAQAGAHGGGAVSGHGHPTAAPQQPDPAKVEIKTEKAAGSVHVLYGWGGNIGVSAGPTACSSWTTSSRRS